MKIEITKGRGFISGIMVAIDGKQKPFSGKQKATEYLLTKKDELLLIIQEAINKINEVE